MDAINDTRPAAEEEHLMPDATPALPITTAAVEILDGIREMRIACDYLGNVAQELERIRGEMDGKLGDAVERVRFGEVLVPIPAGQLCELKIAELGRAFERAKNLLLEIGASVNRAAEAGALPPPPLRITHQVREQEPATAHDLDDGREPPRDLDEELPLRPAERRSWILRL